MKYLVVDDSATMRRIVVNTLQRIGVTDVIEAADGKDAIEKFNESVGFIITDWNMPNMGGLDLAKAVRAHPAGKNVPILMVTARSMREDIMTALNSDVNSYIVKPFTPQILKEKIDALNSATATANAA